MVFIGRQPFISQQKLFLLLILVLNFEIQQIPTIQRHFERDLHFCSTCFQHQIAVCRYFFQNLEYQPNVLLHNLLDLLPLSGNRVTQLLQLKHNKTRIIGKYLASGTNLKILRSQLNSEALSAAFINSDRVDGFQYCPLNTTKHFEDYIRHREHNLYDELTIQLYKLVNVQPLLLPCLEVEGFPVPQTYATCGFTMLQAYGGKALVHFYDADFGLKMDIAKQLLEAMLKFSYGLDSFHIYITDLNTDNIVYDETLNKLYLVDLDTVLIVDSEAVTAPIGGTHKHEYIECDDCFAYSPQDICAHRHSDINLFAACQLLREDLRRNLSRGFLKPIPKEISDKYPEFIPLLDLCVDCLSPKCENRFAVASKLIALFESILTEVYI